MNLLPIVCHIAAGFYMIAVFILALYGLHSLWLMILFLQRRRGAIALERAEQLQALPADADLPHLLVQLPVFNERDVVERLVDAVGTLDYPADKLHIQLLDDSTDDSVLRGESACARLRARGLDAQSLHRIDRHGFKAGALAEGMAKNDAPFIAIFDADFVPTGDFLRRALRPLLNDPDLALVQGRWEHLNRHANLLTAAQSLGIDGHFAIEQGARAWSGLAMNFNGTCGLWRRSAIIAAGGWEHDTLTEDMDLSYRAQLKGWKCTYRTGLAVPGEVPQTVNAWRAQQFRWAKGSIQTAMKLLPQVWKSRWNLHSKLAATLHMTHYMVHPLILVSLFCAPLTMLLIQHLPIWMLTLGLAGFLVGATAPLTVYAVSQFALYGKDGWRNLRYLPALAALGTGIAVSNATAVWQALRGKQSAFVRTPKQGAVGTKKPVGSYRAKSASGMAELFCAGWAALGLAVGAEVHTWITPLLALYFSGFGWMAYFSMRERFATDGEEPVRTPTPLPFLVPIGLLLCAGYLMMGSLAGTWRTQPVVFTSLALGLATLYMLGVFAVRSRPGGRWSLAWIALIAVGIRLAVLGMAPADDVSRYMLEGRQVAHGLNPYTVGYLDNSVRDISSELPPDISGVDHHPNWTTVYPPVMLGYEGLVTTLSVTPMAFKIAAMLCDLAAVGLILAAMLRMNLAPTLIILAAWNPIGPLFFAGEGHNDAVMELLLALGVYLLSGNHFRRSIFAFTLATLTKPFTAPLLLPTLLGRSRWWWLLPPGIAIVAYLPFIDAGLQPLQSMWMFGIQMHFNGALEPLVREAMGWWLTKDIVQSATVGILAAIFLTGATLIVARWRRNSQASTLDLTVRLMAMLLLCLPTLHAWYLAPLVPLLPFTRSWGLVLWTAMAPIYWLHAMADVQGGEMTEIPWVTALAHLPALAVLGYEAWGRSEPIPAATASAVPEPV